MNPTSFEKKAPRRGTPLGPCSLWILVRPVPGMAWVHCVARQARHAAGQERREGIHLVHGGREIGDAGERTASRQGQVYGLVCLLTMRLIAGYAPELPWLNSPKKESPNLERCQIGLRTVHTPYRHR